MSKITSRLEQLRQRLDKKTIGEDLDMGIDFYSCDLGPKCPMRKEGQMYGPKGLLIVDHKCQHRLKADDEV